MTRVPTHPADPFGGPETGLPTRFRLEYLAFRELHREAYLEYAHIRTGSRKQASHCVDNVFDRLRPAWHIVLRGCPAAAAWDLLREEVGHLADCAPGHGWRVHCLLEGRQADVVLLHRRMNLSVNETSHLMGVPAHTVRGLLRGADRALQALPPCLAALFTDALRSTGAHPADAAHQPRHFSARVRRNSPGRTSC